MAYKRHHMKRCSISLIIRERQINTTMKYHLIPVRMTVIKKTTNINIGGHMIKGDFLYIVGSVQFSSVTWLCPILCNPMNRSMPGLPVHHHSPRVHSTSHPLSRWCHPAISSSVIPFSSSPQSLPESVFSNESTLRMRWPKYWSFRDRKSVV